MILLRILCRSIFEYLIICSIMWLRDELILNQILSAIFAKQLKILKNVKALVIRFPKYNPISSHTKSRIESIKIYLSMIRFYWTIDRNMGHSVQQWGNAIRLAQELELYRLSIHQTLAKYTKLFMHKLLCRSVMVNIVLYSKSTGSYCLL